MPTSIPALSRAELTRRLPGLSPQCLDLLYGHYEELRRWSEAHSLVGPGEGERLLERHYGESLAALPLLPPAPHGILVDIGSGAGFPGFVLAAACPGLEVTLVEPRQKKAAFLASVCRRTGRQCQIVRSPVTPTLPRDLPQQIDFLTLRALKLERSAWRALLERLRPDGRVLLWTGRSPSPLLAGLEPVGEQPLSESRVRRILLARPAGQEPGSGRHRDHLRIP